MASGSIAIVGGGLAGLSAGIHARLAGLDAVILERHSCLGGVAAAWRRGDYVIDGGIHFVMGHKPGQRLYRLYEVLGIAGNVGFSDLDGLGRFVDEGSETEIDLTSDLETLEQVLITRFPDDSRVIRELLSGARALRGKPVFDFGLELPPELIGPARRLADLWASRSLIPRMLGPSGRPISDLASKTTSSTLGALIENLFLPEVPVWFVQMLLAMSADGQLGLIQGGCRPFVDAMAARFEGLGGEVRLRAQVDEVVVESSGKTSRACGVRLADGTEVQADAVISAADGYETIYQMLGGRFLSDEISARYRTWPLIRPTVIASFGVARPAPQAPPFTIVRLASAIPLPGSPQPMMIVRWLGSANGFAPAGKSIVQVMLETEWDGWNALHADKPAYRQAKARVANDVLDRLERFFPGIAAEVEMTDIATPVTTWRYTRNREGAYMGWLPTPRLLMTAVPRTLPGLDDFYMAGQWVMPGGGVPAVLFSGRHAVTLATRKMTE